MKKLYSTLVTVAVSAALTACGGSNDSDQQLFATSSSVSDSGAGEAAGTTSTATTGIANDDVASSGDQSLLLDGDAADSNANDLSISDVTVEDGNDTLSYRFTVTDTGGFEIPLDDLSVALEVAATGSFADSYTVPLFDIRGEGDSSSRDIQSFSARSTGTKLPAGSYISRLVVNPNWQHDFDAVPEGGDARPFHYIDERDYSNNASATFQVSVGGSYACEEDGFENNDSVSTAVEIPTGGQISASLCLDDADYYSVNLSESEATSLNFDYTDTQNNPSTRYVVLDANFNRVTEPTVARESNRIVISADSAGQYYLVLFGGRSTYRITRAGGDGILDDEVTENLFQQDTVTGPDSWLHGEIELTRLALSEAVLVDQTVNCGRITTEFKDDQPVAYVTPSHFAEIHEFRFLADGKYLVDGDESEGWSISDGDVSNNDWYDNGFPGYAQKISDNEWRYWSEDGLAYSECTLEINR